MSTLHFIRFLFGTSWVIYPKFYSIWTTKEHSSPLSKMAVAERVERLEMLGQCMKFDPKVRYVFHFVVRLKAFVDFSSICKKNVDIFKSFT